MTLNLTIFSVLLLLVLFSITENRANECGKVDLIEGRITGGTQTSKGEWPFIAALYYYEKSQFFCGGTLISSKNVLSAAHCVQQKNSARKLAPEDLAVFLGRYNLEKKIESGSLQRDVKEIYVHPDWKIYNEKYDADLAIFVLKELVPFSHLIRPVCLPTDNHVDDIEGLRASIVGWGVSENTKPNKHEFIPRHVLTSALNDSYCYTVNPLVAVFSSQRCFCGSGDEGTANSGDSGGGYFVLVGYAWVQYGIISASLSDATGNVQANAVTVYTKIKAFTNWIDEIVEKTEGILTTRIIVNGELKQINMECSYETDYNTAYTCSLHGLDITERNVEVASFSGSNIPEYTEQNVTVIYFWHGTIVYIPEGIGKLFANLEKFQVSFIGRNLGLKLLQRLNFKNMPFLWYLNVNFNVIDTVDEDTLEDLLNLKVFDIRNNNLKVLNKNTFSKNTQLRYVNANSNELEFLHTDLFKTNLLLAEALFRDNKLTTILCEFSKLASIRNIDFHGNSCIDQALIDVQNNVTNYQILLKDHCAG